MLSPISIFFSPLAHTITQISSPLSYKLWTEIKQSVVFMTNIRLFLSPLHLPLPPPLPPLSQTQKNNPFISWAGVRKRQEKWQVPPKNSPRNGVKVRVRWGGWVGWGQRSRVEKVNRDRGREKRKQVFWISKTSEMSQVQHSERRKGGKSSRWIYEILTSLLYIIDNHLQLALMVLARLMAGGTCSKQTKISHERPCKSDFTDSVSVKARRQLR